MHIYMQRFKSEGTVRFTKTEDLPARSADVQKLKDENILDTKVG